MNVNRLVLIRTSWPFSRLGGCIVFGVSVAYAQQSKTQQSARHSLDLTVVKPETVGFSSERLENLHAMMQEAVDQKQLAGIVTILARHGKVIDYRTYGQSDLASRRADDQGCDLPRLLDDQAHHRCGDDDAV